jgi:hypothetical protein
LSDNGIAVSIAATTKVTPAMLNFFIAILLCEDFGVTELLVLLRSRETTFSLNSIAHAGDLLSHRFLKRLNSRDVRIRKDIVPGANSLRAAVIDRPL